MSFDNTNVKAEDIEFLDVLDVFSIEPDDQLSNGNTSVGGVLSVDNSEATGMDGDGEEEDYNVSCDDDDFNSDNDNDNDSTDHSHDRDSYGSGGGSGGVIGGRVGSGGSDSNIVQNGKKRRRATKYKDEDSELIKLATTENLKSQNIDPNSKEGKMIKRKIRNRMSAQFHRERKKAYIDDLELLVKEKNAVIEVLRKKNLELVKQNEELKNFSVNINDRSNIRAISITNLTTTICTRIRWSRCIILLFLKLRPQS